MTANKKDYYKLLCITVSFIALLYIFFGEFTAIAWGNDDAFQEDPLITSSLP